MSSSLPIFLEGYQPLVALNDWSQRGPDRDWTLRTWSSGVGAVIHNVTCYLTWIPDPGIGSTVSAFSSVEGIPRWGTTLAVEYTSRTVEEAVYNCLEKLPRGAR